MRRLPPIAPFGAPALLALSLAAAFAAGCFGPVGLVGEVDGTELPRLRYSAYTDVLFGGGNSVVWAVVGDTPDLCGTIADRVNAGLQCFDGWGETERLHLRLPGEPGGDYPVEGGPCFVAFGDLPLAAACWERDDGLGLTGIGGASADSGFVSIVTWRALDHLGGRLDVTFPNDAWALGSFESNYCPILNSCCSQVPGGCF